VADGNFQVARDSWTPGRTSFAQRAAEMASILSPWWRFRVWARLAGPGAYANHPDADGVMTRVWPHNATMELRRGDWMERYAIEAGRFYQDDLIYTILTLVKPGDTFIDIGANIGFVTLTASRLVGSEGRVISVEANQDLVARLSRTLTQNSISNVDLRHVALGATTGEVVLKTQDHHGTSHIDFQDKNGQTVPLKRGDDVFGVPPGPVFVKIDVEGAEQMVLEGLPNLIGRQDVTWLIEICERQLARFGATPQSIFDRMTAAGYEARAPGLSPLSARVHLKPLARPSHRPLCDVLFQRPERRP
jgi:FkbM family methyltransferase